jgi:hypothetical protein
MSQRLSRLSSSSIKRPNASDSLPRIEGESFGLAVKFALSFARIVRFGHLPVVIFPLIAEARIIAMLDCTETSTE